MQDAVQNRFFNVSQFQTQIHNKYNSCDFYVLASLIMSVFIATIKFYTANKIFKSVYSYFDMDIVGL